MPKIKFLRDPRDREGGDKGMSEGKTVDVSEQSAHHWVKRGAAEYVQRGGGSGKSDKPSAE